MLAIFKSRNTIYANGWITVFNIFKKQDKANRYDRYPNHVDVQTAGIYLSSVFIYR